MEEETKEMEEETSENEAGTTCASGEEKGGKLSAKTISKIFKFAATLGIIACAVLKWLNVMPSATISEICVVWATVYGLGAGTIDLNLMFDKFTGNEKC